MIGFSIFQIAGSLVARDLCPSLSSSRTCFRLKDILERFADLATKLLHLLAEFLDVVAEGVQLHFHGFLGRTGMRLAEPNQGLLIAPGVACQMHASRLRGCGGSRDGQRTMTLNHDRRVRALRRGLNARLSP